MSQNQPKRSHDSTFISLLLKVCDSNGLIITILRVYKNVKCVSIGFS